jgi:polyisoprenoid-binding protein YceI
MVRFWNSARRVATHPGRAAIPLLALAASLAFAFPALRADEGTTPGSITFEAKNLFSTAHGRFHQWRVVRADVDPAEPGRGIVEVEVDVASIDTGIDRRDEHLRTADFFDVENFPTARVRVHDAEAIGPGESGHPRYRAQFDIAIHGVEKTVEGEFELTQASPPTVDGSIVLNRVDFGVGTPYTWWVPGSIEETIPVHFGAALVR